MAKSTEFKNFDDAMTQLLKVPHSEIKEKLDKEKASKAKPKEQKEKNG